MAERSCDVDGCERKLLAKGMCASHYQKARRAEIAASQPSRRRQRQFCSVEGCDSPCVGFGLCRRHYDRHRKYGSTELPEREQQMCEVEGCERAAAAKGLCRLHYGRKRDGGDVGPAELTRRPRAGRTCEVGDCGQPVHSGPLCLMHYTRKWKHGDVGPAHRLKGPRGGHLNADGYRVIYVDGKQVLEHRHLMAQWIGRPLMRHETVHHKHGQKATNTREELELWSKSQPAGQRVEDKLDWCLEFLGEYLATPAYDGALAERVAEMLRRYAPHLLAE